MGNWVEENSSFLFFKGPARGWIDRLVETCPGLRLVDDYRFTYEEWQGGPVEPIELEGWVILPPWMEKDSRKEGMEIILDPGVVFGNGLHATTRDCLRALEHNRKDKPFKEVLDLGTGTGILALAAAFLGAERVLAVDLNPLCVKTAARNVGRNGLEEVVQVVEGPAEAFSNEPADLVIANIHFAVMESLLRRRAFRQGERLILGGLMRTPYREVKALIKGLNFRIVREWDHEMVWFTLLAEKGQTA